MTRAWKRVSFNGSDMETFSSNISYWFSHFNFMIKKNYNYKYSNFLFTYLQSIKTSSATTYFSGIFNQFNFLLQWLNRACLRIVEMFNDLQMLKTLIRQTTTNRERVHNETYVFL